MTAERLVALESAVPELIAEVRRCWRQITELQAANNAELERRREAEAVLRDGRMALQQFALAHPRWEDRELGRQDPCGVHMVLGAIQELGL